MSENGDIYTAGKNFTLPPAVTNLTSETRHDTKLEGKMFTHLILKKGRFWTEIQAHFSYFIKTWPEFGELYRKKGICPVNSWKFTQAQKYLTKMPSFYLAFYVTGGGVPNLYYIYMNRSLGQLEHLWCIEELRASFKQGKSKK